MRRASGGAARGWTPTPTPRSWTPWESRTTTRSSSLPTPRPARAGCARGSWTVSGAPRGGRSSTWWRRRADGSRHARRPRRAPRPAPGQRLLAGRGPVPRDAAFHHLRGHALRSVLHRLLLHPGGGRGRLAGAGRGAAGRDRGREHRNPAVVEFHDALGPGGRAQREPSGPQDWHPDHLPARPDVPHHPGERVRPHRLRPARQRPGHDLLLPDRPARVPRLHRTHPAVVRDDPRLPRPLLGQGAPRRRGAGHLLALRRHHVDLRVQHALRPVAVLNPLRSEQEAFRFLVYVAIAVAVVVGLVLLLRAIL